ncbi:ATM interactor [Genypterus blacodes]|uniref:ATM interactor n=1 Tax=Genypterus blacodes TaxID=154954 RepID=UPI003F7666D9
MHLVKSHRVEEDGGVNPTVRKDLKGSQKLYCCPVEGCPRGPLRPFSQFSLVKQHFMKSHAEKKHKCSKCNHGYSTVWDLKRHAEDCGKTYRCTCGCPYASRPALLSHVYRTGHQVPPEYRIPPVKKRKMEKLLSGSVKVKNSESWVQTVPVSEEPAEGAVCSEAAVPARQSPGPRRSLQKLLPMPSVALLSLPVMQFTHLPVLLPASECGPLRSVVLAVDSQGSLSAVPVLPPALRAVAPPLDAKNLCFKDGVPASRSGLGPISTGVQVDLDPLGSEDPDSGLGGQRGRSTSTDIQTDRSYLSRAPAGVGYSEGESSVSSCSQTDISVSAQVLLPVSVETQTCRAKATSSIGAQTDGLSLSQTPCAPPFSSVAPCQTRQTQTGCAQNRVMICSDLFGGGSLSVSTQTALAVADPLAATGSGLCFGVQTDELNSGHMADNQTQTMTLLSDLENILSEQVLSEAPAGCGAPLTSAQDQNAASDFDFEDFLNTVHIHTQTEESQLGGLASDIQTQTDFLLMDELDQSEAPGRGPAPATDLELEMFDTQTQTDLNFLLSAGSHVPLSSILRHSSFSMSTESSDTETQTDVPSPPAALCAHPGPQAEHAETQTVTSQADGLGHLFLTSNETQTVMDDFLSADLAWNMESHFSSVETQTCEELCALLQQPAKHS